MQIIWLKAFVYLVEAQNFSEAAEELYVSQSSVSKYIRLIEQTIDIALLDRSTKKVKLTEAGTQFYRYAQEIINKYDDMLQAMQEMKEVSKKKIRVASVSAIHIYGYSSLLYQFSKNNKDITFELEETEMSNCMKMLKNGKADFAVVRTNLVDKELGYEEIRFNTEEMIFLCNHRHRLAKRTSVSLEEVMQEKLILQKFAVDEIMVMIQKYHFTIQEMRICAVTTRPYMIFEYVKDDLGSTIVSRGLANHLDPKGELRIIPIKEKPELTLGLLIPHGGIKVLPEHCQRFIEYIKNCLTLKSIDEYI